MSKFTPGPWELDKYGSVITKPGEHVCFYGLSLSGGAEARANGILASAAPDMYEDITEALKEWDILAKDRAFTMAEISDWLIRFMGPAMDKLRQDIAKADGK